MYHISLNFNSELQVFGRKLPLGQSRRTAPFDPQAELLSEVEGRMCRGSSTAVVATLALLLKHGTAFCHRGGRSTSSNIEDKM